jgi:SEC-C motif domain protein
MRSRYSAYALGLGDYLLATWHASTRPATIDFATPPKWLGLSIRNASLPADLQKNQGNAALDAFAAANRPDRIARVEFVARYKLGGRAFRLHETSRFTLEGGRWFYIDGDLHE